MTIKIGNISHKCPHDIRFRKKLVKNQGVGLVSEITNSWDDIVFDFESHW